MLPQHELTAVCLLFGALFAGNASRALEERPRGPLLPASGPKAAPQVDTRGAPVAEQAAALMTRWAPLFVQQVSLEHPERDRPLRVGFDGDWDATNNWVHLNETALREKPVVYGSAILSETHAYLSYVLFYPRDWVSWLCVPYVCHDNDLETALVVVERDTGAGSERLAFVETKTHLRYLALPGESVERGSEGQPIFAESAGCARPTAGRARSRGRGLVAAGSSALHAERGGSDRARARAGARQPQRGAFDAGGGHGWSPAFDGGA
jgi:hypothetical protein